MGYVEKNCPICERHDAKLEIPISDFGVWRNYMCPTCGRIEISDLAEIKLRELPNLRQQFAEKAKACVEPELSHIFLNTVISGASPEYEMRIAPSKNKAL